MHYCGEWREKCCNVMWKKWALGSVVLEVIVTIRDKEDWKLYKMCWWGGWGHAMGVLRGHCGVIAGWRSCWNFCSMPASLQERPDVRNSGRNDGGGGDLWGSSKCQQSWGDGAKTRWFVVVEMINPAACAKNTFWCIWRQTSWIDGAWWWLVVYKNY